MSPARSKASSRSPSNMFWTIFVRACVADAVNSSSDLDLAGEWLSTLATLGLLDLPGLLERALPISHEGIPAPTNVKTLAESGLLDCVDA